MGWSRGDAADIGVMTAIGDEEQNVAPSRLVKDGGDDGDVRKVRAAIIRVVQRHHIA